MAEIVEFKWDSASDGYECDEDCYGGEKSGRYFRESDYKALAAEKEGLERGILAMGAANDALRADVERLKYESFVINEENKYLRSELDLSAARLRFEPLENDNMLHDESEIRRLYQEINRLKSDLAAAVEVLRDYVGRFDGGYFIDDWHYYSKFKVLLARLEVRP